MAAFDFEHKIYFGLVEDNIDPKRKGRIKVRVQSIFDEIDVEDIPYALPYKEFVGENFAVPAKGKIVNIIFENNNLYSPYYIYVEHYNVNLQNRLSIMNDDEYVNFKALMFNHITQIYTDNDSLTLDYKYNKIVLDNENINLNLKDNRQTLNLGSEKCDQDAVLGSHWFEWFDRFVTELVKPSSLIGNLGAPIIKSNLDTLLNEYIQNSTAMKYRSKNVKIVDNNKVKLQKRIVEPDSNQSDITNINSETVSKYLTDRILEDTNKEQDKINESKPSRLIKTGENDYHDNQTEYVATTKDDNGNIITGNTFIVDDDGEILPIDQSEVVDYTNGNDKLSENKQNDISNDTIVDDENYGSYLPIDDENESGNKTNNNVSTKINDMSNITIETPPSKGKVKVYKSGKYVNEKEYVMYDNRLIVKEFYEPLMKMLKAAEKDKVKLILNDAYRDFQSQYNVRNKNKTKPFTDQELKTNSSKLYEPETSPPGYGYHIFGNSFDFATANGTNAAYKWLVKNAFTYGFVRTVKTEYWHWEYKPWEYNLPARPSSNNTQFSYVPKNHPTWNGLV